MTRTTLLNRGSRVSFARTSDSKSCFCCVCLQSVVRLGLIRVGKTADRSRENKEQKRNGPVETTRASRCAGERRRWRRRKSRVIVGSRERKRQAAAEVVSDRPAAFNPGPPDDRRHPRRIECPAPSPQHHHHHHHFFFFSSPPSALLHRDGARSDTRCVVFAFSSSEPGEKNTRRNGGDPVRA